MMCQNFKTITKIAKNLENGSLWPLYSVMRAFQSVFKKVKKWISHCIFKSCLAVLTFDQIIDIP